MYLVISIRLRYINHGALMRFISVVFVLKGKNDIENQYIETYKK